jgi:peptidoglycan/LPS O-acetylase OafA/YrhL
MGRAGGLGTLVGVAQVSDDVAPRTERPEPAPRLRHQPALDGLRGLAVAVVVAFHLDHLRGGFMGVDLFFVLSGYLITSLLLVEHGGRGAIALGRFWSRRARRLLPALFLLLAGVALLIATATPVGERPTLRGDALATLGYVANWQAMADDIDYWDMFSQPSPLDHMWSLAIEEQFYLAWPLLVVGLLALGRRARLAGPGVVAAASAVGAATSFVVLAATYSSADTSRAYYGTDARVGPTLLGAALAGLSAARLRREATEPAVAPAAAPEGRRSAGRGGAAPGGPVAALACLATMAWALAAIDGQGPRYYRGGLLAFALAAVLVVHVVTSGRGGLVTRALSVRPLVALGVISYGVYLWHWPVIVYLTPERAGLDGWGLDAACVAATLVLAVASCGGAPSASPWRARWRPSGRPRSWRRTASLACRAPRWRWGRTAASSPSTRSRSPRGPSASCSSATAGPPTSGRCWRPRPRRWARRRPATPSRSARSWRPRARPDGATGRWSPVRPATTSGARRGRSWSRTSTPTSSSTTWRPAAGRRSCGTGASG